MAAKRRAILTKINDAITLIDDAGESTCYLVEGETGAMLIDSLNGMENLREIVSEITDKPVTLVNTHGHCDHIGGNLFFDKAYMSADDFELFREHSQFPEFKEIMKKESLSFCPLEPLCVGQTFDMGGLPLEIVSLKVHTKGSIGILDRKHRILFSGDGANTHIWLQLVESEPIDALIESLRELLNAHGNEFDYILAGHGKGLEGKDVVTDLVSAAEDFLSGNREGDAPYDTFIQNARIHRYGKNGERAIIYNGDEY